MWIKIGIKSIVAYFLAKVFQRGLHEKRSNQSEEAEFDMPMTYWEKMRDLFGMGSASQANGGEVSVTTCGLVELDGALLGKLGVGTELTLHALGGRVAAMRKDRPAGFLSGQEGCHVARLLEQGARLSCRVVHVGPASPLVRVRISILVE